jgi:hypothetical protein
MIIYSSVDDVLAILKEEPVVQEEMPSLIPAFHTESERSSNADSDLQRTALLDNLKRHVEVLGSPTRYLRSFWSILWSKIWQPHKILGPKGRHFEDWYWDALQGSISNQVQEGDQLFILRGASLPHVLRPVGEKYELVGECYHPGIMNGEQVKNMKNPDREFKWITLI